MMKNHRLAHAIGDVGFAEFKRQLLYKASWYEARVILADRWQQPQVWCATVRETRATCPQEAGTER